MYGWRDKILTIDLDTASIRVDRPEPEIYLKFLGGRGLAGYYLQDFITLDWDDPQMPLLFSTGPLAGTASPSSGWMSIVSRSPLTGTVGDSSVAGSFGTSLKRAGWDMVFITGKSRKLCGIEIVDDAVVITDASHLKGLLTGEAFNCLRGKGSCAVIGPAAENGIRFSSIVVDRHFAAARNGIGLACAAKNIKYVSVKGSAKTDVCDPKALREAREEILRLIAASPALLGEYGIANFGTPALYDLVDARRMMPTRNFHETQFDAAPSMNAHALRKRYEPKGAGCHGCHILCKKIGKAGESLPEFETLSHFSALLENRDLETVVRANRICNEMGMDAISAASTLACYSDIEQRKLSPAGIIAMLEQIGRGAGLGGELGKGAAVYARSRNRSDLAVAVKGQELPAYDPRGAYGMALAYAVSTRGGCHLRANPIGHEILRKPVATDRFTFNGKARIIKIGEDLNAVVDSLAACKFVFFAATLEEYARAFQAVTGKETSAQDLLRVGERVCYLERMMNARNGFSGLEDDLPSLFFLEPGSGCAHAGIPPLDREEFLKARAKYYRIRGLDPQGMPVREKALELGLSWKD